MNNRRLLFLVITIVLCTAFAVFANAAVEIEVGSATYETKATAQTVSIPITLSGNTAEGGILALGIKIEYDEGLTLTKVVKGDGLAGLDVTLGKDFGANPYVILYDGLDAVKSNGVIATLTFSVPANAYEDYNVDLEVTTLYDNDMTDLEYNVTNGAITVEKPEVSIDVASVTGEAGKSVDVPITLSGNTSPAGILGLGIEIEYDEGITLTKVTNGTGLSGLDYTPGGDISANPYKIMWDGLNSVNTNGTIATLSFAIPEGAAKDYSVNVTVTGLLDYNLKSIAHKVTNGKISVSASGVVAGTDLIWTCVNNKLTITGSGDIPNYTSTSPAPWSAYAATAQMLEISDGITTIGNRAFVSFSKLTSAVIPDSVTKIGSYAFASCSALTEVTIGSNVRSIGSNAFNSCSALDKVHISSFDDWCKISFASMRANPANLAGKFYIDGEHCTEVILTAGDVTSIGAYAFRSTDITKMHLPTSVTSIGTSALSYCDDLIVYCYADSYGEAYCQENGIPYELLACEHEYGNWTETEKATCTEEGIKERSCIHCGETETAIVPVIGHSYVSKIYAPTCTENGYTEHICSGCGASYKNNETKMTGHSFGEWITEKEPTTSEEGIKTRKCENCDATESEAIPELTVGSAVFTLSSAEARVGDTVKLVLSVKSTAVANSIALSNIEYDEDVLEFIGFDDYEAIEELAAFTPVFDAEKGYFLIALAEEEALDCDLCTLEFKVKDVDADVVATVSATPILKFDSLQIPSEFEEGEIEVFTYLKGDIDGDDDVDVDDAVYLFGMTMLPQFYPNNYLGNTDINRDGKVDLQDAILLFNYSILPDIYPID